MRPPGCGSPGGPAAAALRPIVARFCRSTATAIPDPPASSVRPAPRDPRPMSGPRPAPGQALDNRRLASRPRPPNPLRWFVLRQFLQTPPDRARRHAGCHRHRGNATITRSKRFRRRDQATAPFVEKRRYRGKPLPDVFNIDPHHNIWYDRAVVNPYLTLSKVDSIISGRVLTISRSTPRNTATLSSPTGTAPPCG